jgi:hydrogenase maturation protein HypF
MLRSGTGCVPTTSVGRLFDAVSALLGICQQADYEAQAAIELEAVVGTPPATAGEITDMAVAETPDGLVVDPAGLIASLVRDVATDVAPSVSAWRFHASLARAVRTVARHVRDTEGVQTIGLTGGVFQNALMTTECARSLLEDGFDVLVHRRVPPNDGGLALGQTMIAACGGGR